MVATWKIVLATMIVFGCGVITGSLVTRQPNAVPVAPVVRSVSEPMPPAPSYQLQKLEFLRKIEKHLALSPEQKEKIEKIMHQSQERTKPVFEQIAPQMREELKRVREEIRAELSPEQRKKFELLLKNRPGRKDEVGTDEKRRRTPIQKQEPAPVPIQSSVTN